MPLGVGVGEGGGVLVIGGWENASVELFWMLEKSRSEVVGVGWGSDERPSAPPLSTRPLKIVNR